MGMGAAAGGSAVAFNQPVGEKEKSVILACDSYHDAEHWVQVIDQQLSAMRASGVVPSSTEFVARTYAPPAHVRLTEVEEWIKSSKWQVYSVADGVRVFEYQPTEEQSGAAAATPAPPCLRVNVGVNGSASDVFMAVMNMPPACRTGAVRTVRIVESIDNCTDVVHIVLEPIFVYPTWTGSYNATTLVTSKFSESSCCRFLYSFLFSSPS